MLKKIVFAALAFLFLLLQVQLWGTEGTRATLREQKQQQAELLERIEHHEEHIEQLQEENAALRQDPGVVEARARHDFGMIKPDETLIFVTPTETAQEWPSDSSEIE